VYLSVALRLWKVGEQDADEFFQAVHISPLRLPVSATLCGEDSVPSEDALPVRGRAAFGVGEIL